MNNFSARFFFLSALLSSSFAAQAAHMCTTEEKTPLPSPDRLKKTSSSDSLNALKFDFASASQGVHYPYRSETLAMIAIAQALPLLPVNSTPQTTVVKS